MIRLEQYDNKNLRKLITDDYTIWFSYETPIAFQADYGTIATKFVAKNEWSNTTGRHLGIIKREMQIFVEVPHGTLMAMIEDFI